jgi:hypothetical protein
MTDTTDNAPDRIWYNGNARHARELRWSPPESDVHPTIEYIRADIPATDAQVMALVERVLDAAADYLNKQYGLMALYHPTDRARVIAAFDKGGKDD